MSKIVETAAAENVTWQGPVATGFEGKGDTVSAGRGQWHDSALFMIHCSDESLDVFLGVLRDNLRGTIELAGAKLNEPDRSTEDSGNHVMQFTYTHGNHNGTIVARIGPASEDARRLVPGGQSPSHQLVFEVAETFQLDSQ